MSVQYVLDQEGNQLFAFLSVEPNGELRLNIRNVENGEEGTVLSLTENGELFRHNISATLGVVTENNKIKDITP